MRAIALTTAATLAVLAMPAAAQDAEPDTDLAPVIAQMSDPAFQDTMAVMIGSLGEVLLDMTIGPLAEAVERAGGEPTGYGPDARVRDVAGPDAQDLPAELAARTPQMMDAASGMARSLEAMMPVLRAWSEEMAASVAHARDRADRSGEDFEG